MLVFCEECGEKYIFESEDEEKDLESFSCRYCGEKIVISKPSDSNPESGSQ